MMNERERSEEQETRDVFKLEMADREGGVRGAAEDGERGMPESDEWEDSIQ
jgi:hypothetical protein